eukprot:12910896-Prorocentrum_lima.AAC.1
MEYWVTADWEFFGLHSYLETWLEQIRSFHWTRIEVVDATTPPEEQTIETQDVPDVPSPTMNDDADPLHRSDEEW